ncbi:MAG: DUF4410 domain-containing protein [Candidatus Eisenbacteria bacterium]
MIKKCYLLVAGLAVVILAGCAKNYVITQPLAQLIAAPATVVVAEIADELPVDMPPEKKPKPEDVQKLRRFLVEAIADKKVGTVQEEGGDALYEVHGSLLEYRRGSGAARFFIGFGVGSAKTTVALKLVDRKSGSTIFGGNFYGAVTSWAEGGEKMFQRVAKDFAKELAKQIKTPTAGS